MIRFEEALEIIQTNVYLFNNEEIDTLSSIGRVLAEDVIADMDMPPFDKSAMDGYACRYADIANKLKVIEIIPAGKIPEKSIAQNQCAKIMTGAMIPVGADCVLMVEHTEKVGDDFIRYTEEIKQLDMCNLSRSVKRTLNICYRAEDIRKGDLLISKGKIIRPQHIATMASVGYTRVKVAQQPKVAIIPTGNEIVEPDRKPSVSEIRNSNAYQLLAQLKNMGIEASYYGIAKDTEKETIQLIQRAFNENDIILLTGGVSMGDFDLVPEILQKLDFELLFQEISVQPGKPTVFGKNGKKFCFGLPGNPVSCFVQFELLVKTLINGLMGLKCRPHVLRFPLATSYERKNSNRTAFFPVNINKQGEAELVDYHGSAHISGFTLAWGLMEVPLGINCIAKGEMVNVRQL